MRLGAKRGLFASLLPFLLGAAGDYAVSPPPHPGRVDCTRDSITEVESFQAMAWLPIPTGSEIHYPTISIYPVCHNAFLLYQGGLSEDGKQVKWSKARGPVRVIPEPNQWVMLGAGLILLWGLWRRGPRVGC